ncbi:MAG: hypothetical protein ACR2K2_04620 [Mycobacteriales bacterium]
MTTARRWWLVAVGVVVLVAAPVLVHALPAGGPDISAPTLLQRIQGSADVPYAGYAESAGSLSLPAPAELSGLGDLLGGRTRLRTWWRSADDWRVDNIRATGESDLFHDARGTTRWVYESLTATRRPNLPVRLPDPSDLLPPTLARRMLAGARADEVSRLPAMRIAGRVAPGLRLRPSDPASGVDHVDVWADADSGVPLRVDVDGTAYDTLDRAGVPALTTAFQTFSSRRPAASVTAFNPPPGATLRFDRGIDIAAAADQFAHSRPPSRLAGLAERPGAPTRAVGVYGSGPTLLVAVPLWSQVARPLHDELESTAGMRRTPIGVLVGAGPLGVLLTYPDDTGSSWLVGGTVTPETLRRAVAELPKPLEHP